MNLPNQITVGRFILALLFFAFWVLADLSHASEWWKPVVAASIFLLAVATDALDGHLARKLGLLTDFGRIADPAADKIIVAGGFVFLAASDWARPMVPVWMVVLIISRELLVTALRGFIEARGIPFPARWDGKVKMIVQCIAIPAVCLARAVDLGAPGERWLVVSMDWLAFGSIWLTFVLTMVSGWRYVTHAAAVLRQQGETARSP